MSEREISARYHLLKLAMELEEAEPDENTMLDAHELWERIADCAEHERPWEAAYAALLAAKMYADFFADRSADIQQLRPQVKEVTDVALALLPHAERGIAVSDGGRKGASLRRRKATNEQIDHAMRLVHHADPELLWSPAADAVGQSCGLSGRQVRRRTSVRW